MPPTERTVSSTSGLTAYQLCIEGEDITPVYRLIEVGIATWRSACSTGGTGRVAGTMHFAGGLNQAAWPFADIYLSELDRSRTLDHDGQERHLVAGEDGRFAFEHVPEGFSIIEVGAINSMFYVPPFGWVAQVVAGKTTEIHAFGRGNDGSLEVSIVVGNGSRRDFQLGSADRKSADILLSLFGGESNFTLELTQVKPGLRVLGRHEPRQPQQPSPDEPE